jgi:hypothetical protein
VSVTDGNRPFFFKVFITKLMRRATIEESLIWTFTLRSMEEGIKLVNGEDPKDQGAGPDATLRIGVVKVLQCIVKGTETKKFKHPSYKDQIVAG